MTRSSDSDTNQPYTINISKENEIQMNTFASNDNVKDTIDGTEEEQKHATTLDEGVVREDHNLSMLQAAALLTADCLGTGLLALPQDIQVLGWAIGITFLVLNIPINWYAGTILSNAALEVEHREQERNDGDGVVIKTKRDYMTVHNPQEIDEDAAVITTVTDAPSAIDQPQELTDTMTTRKNDALTTSATHDYVAMAQTLFRHPVATNFQPRAVHLVALVYYSNIFLVLGDYILVQSHAVVAMIGEDSICLPVAGLVASSLMFAFAQIRTMAKLGHYVTAISLICLAIVVIQCLVAGEWYGATNPPLSNTDMTPLRKFAALASIGFATGSNKLILNIRNEMTDRRDAPKTLAVSLTVYGSVYVAICIFAGPNPPSFLFDAIPPGSSRRIAGLLLWIHVAVSYAINSQAICSSLDHLLLTYLSPSSTWISRPGRRWLCWTVVMTVSSYLVANMVPFFKDLVALIGALTSVPLTFLFPAWLHRRLWEMPICLPTRQSLGSFALLLFGFAFLFLGLSGALSSIQEDWTHQGAPFSCYV